MTEQNRQAQCIFVRNQRADVQGRNEGVNNFPYAESLWGAESLRGAPDNCGRRRKAPTMSQVLFNRVDLLPKDLRFEHGGAKMPWALSTLITPRTNVAPSLRPCLRTNVATDVPFNTLQYDSIRVICSHKKYIHFGVAKL